MQKKERKIRDLFKDGKECVWLFIESEDLCREFFNKAYEEGFFFGSLKRRKWVTGDYIAVHSDGSMGHLPYFARSRMNAENSGIIDFRRFRNGEDDYLLRR